MSVTYPIEGYCNIRESLGQTYAYVSSSLGACRSRQKQSRRRIYQHENVKKIEIFEKINDIFTKSIVIPPIALHPRIPVVTKILSLHQGYVEG